MGLTITGLTVPVAVALIAFLGYLVGHAAASGGGPASVPVPQPMRQTR